MAKDYAKSTFKAARTSRQRRSRSRFFALVFSLVLIGLCVPVSWYLYQNKTVLFTKGNAETWVEHIKSLIHRNKLATAANSSTKTDLTQPVAQEPEIRFDFYTELPSMQVTLPATQTEANKGVPPPVAIQATAAPKKLQVPAETIVQTKPQFTAGTIAQSRPQFTAGTSVETPLPQKQEPVVKSESPAIQYVVQIGAYKNDSTASEMRVSMLLAGFDVSVIKTKIGDQIVYRIQQGPFSSMNSAKSAQKKLQSKGYDGVVQKLNG